MAPAISERVELANFCRSKDWSKAIRVLDSLIAKSCTVQDIWSFSILASLLFDSLSFDFRQSFERTCGLIQA